MNDFMNAQNNVVSFRRDDDTPELHSYARYATARALAAAIYEAGITPDDLFEAMQDHLEHLDN